jgi:signal transduction histidine kinase
VEQERLRIAGEVHDVVAHTLSVVVVQADAGLQVLSAAGGADDKGIAAARQALQCIADSGRDALAELRSTVRVLRADGDAPHEPARGIDEIPALLEPARQSGVEIELEIDADGHVPAIVGLSAYRIVQEAVTNALRHARPARLIVRVSGSDGWLDVLVRDDGGDGASGPAAAAAAATESPGSSATGHGITGMAGRVAALGGSFAAGPLPGGGFEVRATLPLEAHA